MLNDSQITNNIVSAERIENVASNVAADNDRSMNFMNIAANISDQDFMNIAAIINEANFMNFSQDINEKDVIEENDIIVKKNSIHAERLRRQTLLKRITNSKDAEEDSNIMKKSSSSRKKLILKNLSTKFKKKLKNQTLNKLRSSQEKEDKEIIINEKNYYVECTIKYLHSCARFIVKNFSTNLLILKSSRKSTKLAINKKLTKIFCEITKNFASNKI
jgi:hypothetical protein